jgi:ribose 1,5-bisphosphokinase
VSAAGPGCLVLVVGPSGAGKDSVMHGAREALIGNRDFVFPRRFVTRLNVPAAEDHVSMTEMEFAIAVAEDAFCLWWGAHGNYYGIGQAVEGDIAAGAIVVINCSRTAIADACSRFRRVSVVEITAPPEVLVARIVARGRETAEQAQQRVARQVPDYPPGVAVRRIVNDGPLGGAVQQFCAVLTSLQNAGADPGGSALDGENQQENGDNDGRGLVIIEHL